MALETSRLMLRPWKESDAPELYKYASDPLVGNSAGWLRHRCIEDSLQAIWRNLSEPEAYAIVLKDTGLPIGNISLTFHYGLAAKDDEAELGYWLGVPYWGKAL